MKSEKTIIQIASLPEREDHLKLTVDSLVDQADSLFVALNGYTEVPDFLKDNEKISYKILDNSLGDAAKFYGIEDLDGYLFTCDDDLIYPQGYISYLLNGIKRYDSIVTILGKVYDNLPVPSFRKGYTRLFSCLNSVKIDAPVHVGGTGVMGFHTDRFKLDLSAFKRKNMSDIWVAKAAYEQGVPIMSLAHPSRYVIYHKFPWRIWLRDHDDTYQTEIMNSFLNHV